MVAIDMEMPSKCWNCSLCGSNNGGHNYCIYTGNRIMDFSKRADNCPLVEIEPLTDSEQRIFLAAITREMRICKEIDNNKVDDGTVKKLEPIVNGIERKVKKTLWD